MKRSRFVAQSATLPVVALAAWGLNAGAQEPDKLIRVGGALIDDFKTVFYGIQSGLFHRYGLNVEVSPMRNGAASLAALVGGSIDVAFPNLVAVCQGYLRGLPFRLVSPAEVYDTNKADTFMLVRKDAVIRTAADLNGKDLGAQAATGIQGIGMRAWIDQNGGDSKSVRILEIPSSALGAALTQGRVEAVILVEPFAQDTLALGKTRVLCKPFDAIGKRFEVSGLVAMEPNIAANSDAFQRFGRAMQESIRYTNTHFAETVDLVASFTHVSPNVIANSVRTVDADVLDPQLVQPLIDVAAKYGLIERSFNARELFAKTAPVAR